MRHTIFGKRCRFKSLSDLNASLIWKIRSSGPEPSVHSKHGKTAEPTLAHLLVDDSDVLGDYYQPEPEIKIERFSDTGENIMLLHIPDFFVNRVRFAP